MNNYNVVNLLNKEVSLVLTESNNFPIAATILNISEPFVWVRYRDKPETVRVIPIDKIYYIRFKDEL